VTHYEQSWHYEHGWTQVLGTSVSITGHWSEGSQVWKCGHVKFSGDSHAARDSSSHTIQRLIDPNIQGGPKNGATDSSP